jgi:hypothetical protein
MATQRSFLYERILKQYAIGPWLGALKDLSGRTMFYMTPVNLFMLSATTYQITARDFIWQFAPWVNFWMFFGALVFAALCAMVVEYKIVFPSSIFFSNAQGYKHGNPIRRDLEVVMHEIQKIEAKLDALDAKYNEYSGENKPST